MKNVNPSQEAEIHIPKIERKKMKILIYPNHTFWQWNIYKMLFKKSKHKLMIFEMNYLKNNQACLKANQG